MLNLLYNAGLRCAAPLVRRHLNADPAHRPLLARFESPSATPEAPIWIQACSVGEVNTAAPLVAALQEALPEVPVLLTASTTTGHALAQKKFGEEQVAWFPFDTPAAVRAFYDAVQPRLLVLIETELWPNVIAEAKRRGVPVLIVNGRISEKHFGRYRRARPLLRSMFGGIAHAAMQSDDHASRLAALGVAPERITVTGNLKYDAAPSEVASVLRKRLRAEYGFGPEDPILIFGSTHPGEEALASACWTVLREEFPRLRLIVAPRHIDRIAEAITPFGAESDTRSAMKHRRPATPPRVVHLDTHGELVNHYAIATLVVIGGSFYPGVEGHNPLEAAALGVPTVFGPHMKNFDDMVRALKAADAASQVSCPEDLYDCLHHLLSDSAGLQRRGTAARRVVLEGRGATARNVDLIQHYLQAEKS